MRSITKDKKGNFFQIIFLLVIIFIAAVFGLLTYSWSGKMVETMQDSGVLGNTSGYAYRSTEIINTNSRLATDYLVFFLFLGGSIGLLISASRTNFSPVVLFLFAFEILITLLFASGIVNIYQGLAQGTILYDYSGTLTLTNIVLSRYTPLIMMVIESFVLMIMLGKSKSTAF